MSQFIGFPVHDLVDHLKSNLELGKVMESYFEVSGNDLLYKNGEDDRSWSLGGENLKILALGKAACSMAQAMCETLNELQDPVVIEGLAVTKVGHGFQIDGFEVIESSHPYPSELSVIAANTVVKTLREWGANDPVVVLLSGGASALLCSPGGEISLQEKMDVTKQLLSCAAPIQEVNVVRKAISLVKGGSLARQLKSSNCRVFVASDVVGNDLETISSAPFYGKKPTPSMAIQVLQKYDLMGRVNPHILSYLAHPIKPQRDKQLEHSILTDCQQAVDLLKEFVSSKGFEVLEFDNLLEGLSQEIVDLHIQKLEGRTGTFALISGGESTIQLEGNGKGGRNQQFCLEMAIALKDAGVDDFYVFSYGTDGTDGPTDAAGGYLDSQDLQSEESVQALKNALKRNDSYNYLTSRNRLLKTGPTGTNVNDVHLVLVSIPEAIKRGLW